MSDLIRIVMEPDIIQRPGAKGIFVLMPSFMLNSRPQNAK
jgi:hypothetical protein